MGTGTSSTDNTKDYRTGRSLNLGLFVAQKNTKRRNLWDSTTEKKMIEQTEKKKGMNGVPKGYLGVADMCRLFGRSRATIYEMIADGRLPKPLKDKKLNLWDEKQIESWLKHAKFCK